MKVGLIPAYGGGVATTGTFVRQVAGEAEAAGFESLWVGEHVALPVQQRSAYPGAREGLKAPSSAPLPDPLEWLSFAAATTDTLLLGTAILLAPLHHPLVLAKRVATLDQLSGGRLRLGIGIGWNQQEYEAVGVPWERRGLRCDETIAALRAAWRDDEASYTGTLLRFEPVFSVPKPVRTTVPILVGGSTEAAARRAGRLGDGFFPFERDHDRLARLVDAMRDAAAAAGRDPAAIEITCLGSLQPAKAAHLAELGVERMVVFMAGPDAASIAGLGARCRDAVAGL